MAKNIDNEQERNDRAFRDHMNSISQERVAQMREQFQDAFTKAAENAAKNRKRKLAREVSHCLLAMAGIAGLYLAESAGLIASVITNPVGAIALVYIGWHLCKIDRLRGRK